MGNLLCCVLVKQSDVAIKERFGKFQKVLNPGLQFVPWVIGDYVAGHLTLRLQQLDVQCETKTKDNVFVTVVASIQYRVLVDKASDAFYRLSNPTSQIKAYVFDVIRACVPKLNLDDVFEQKNEIAKSVEEELDKAMTAYAKDVLDMVMMTQYFDTMRDIGASSKSSSVFIPHGPGAVADVAAQIRNGLLQAHQTNA
ncbi:hypothetical protein BRARA_E03641 [Brassica rapa]|uniref:Band 7 domain-containing protein n=1 Tax=Brassica campestris TaxID=3711 RepID=A0A397ZQ55_BRACM|nr:hypothetical protein BRARA_E03641 [Brassica rapa]